MIGCRGKPTVHTKTCVKNWIAFFRKSAQNTWLLFLRCLALAAVTFVRAQAQATPSKLEQELRQVRQQIYNAYNSGDKATVERLIADDYIVINLEGNRFTKADAIKGVRDPKEAAKFKETEIISDLQVRDYGDVALMSYALESNAQSGEQKFHSKMRSTDVYRRRNGQWQLVAVHVTKIP